MLVGADEGAVRALLGDKQDPLIGVVAGGLAVVSLVFATVHFNLNAFVPILVLGAMLGLAYEVTGTILVPITVHALFNTANLVVLLFAPKP